MLKTVWIYVCVPLLITGVYTTRLYAEGDIITWDICVRDAEKYNPDLISAREALFQAKKDKVSVQSKNLPQINGSAGKSSSKTEGSDRTDSYSYSVSGRQLLFDGLAGHYDVSKAKKEVASGEYDYQIASSNVRLRLKTAFTELLKAQELVGITEEIYNRRVASEELVKLRYKAGREHKGALLTAEANSAQAKFETDQAGRNLDIAKKELIKIIGKDTEYDFRAEGDFEVDFADRDKPDFEELALGTPFLKELILRREIARLDVKSSGAGYFPQVYASASYNKSDSEWPPGVERKSLGLNLSVPIFQGGAQAASVSKTKSRLRQAESDEKDGKYEVLLTLEETWKNLQDSIDSVEVQRKFLDAANERAKIAEAQYSNGLINFDSWIIIEDDLVRVKKSYINAQANSVIAEALWIQAKGGTLDYEK